MAHEVAAQRCDPHGVSVQILGSGGPRLNQERASTSYLLWIDGRARLLVDLGGGSFLRLGQSRANIADLSLVAISHLHPDHVADLPAFLWLSQLSRQARLPIAGPSGSSTAPEFATFLHRLFDEKTGAFPLLAPVLGARQGALAGGVPLDITVVDVEKHEASTVFGAEDLTVRALGIPHGDVPTLAYRVESGGVSIVFSSDQTGTDPAFTEFANGASLLIMHLMIGAGATNPLHAAPSVVGRVARDARAKQLAVGHIGQFDLDAAVRELKEAYRGPLTVGADLRCLPVK